MDRTGSRIRARRLDAGMAQRDLALQVGISPSYLNLIEHDRRRIGGKLLGQIAAALGLETALLSDGADADSVARLRSAAAALGDVAVEAAQAGDLAARYPGWARLIAAQAERIAALDQRLRLVSDRLAHDPALSEALHGVISAVTSIQSTAAILTGDTAVDADWQARFHRNILDDSARLARTSAALIAYFDAAAEGPGTAPSAIEALEHLLALTDFHRAGQEPGADPATVPPDPPLPPAVRDLRDAHDRRYAADAAALPLDLLLPVLQAEGHDPLRTAARLGRPLAQVLRRMAGLPPGTGGGGTGLLICDAAGVVRLFKPLPGVVLPRATLCPLWPIFTALGQPGRPVTLQAALPDAVGSRIDCHAIAEIVPHPAGPHLPPLIEAVMLMRAGAAQGPVPPVPVGAGCRLCPRPDCPARREPAVIAGRQAL